VWRVPDGNGRNPGRRADSRATRGRLLTALGRLLDHGHSDVTLQTVAEEAGVSTATAYRYFGSTEDAVIAYIVQFPDAVASAVAEREAGETGLARLELWSNTWIRLTDEGWGPSLVQLRSPEGFIARRESGNPAMQPVFEHLEPAMVEALDDLGIPADALDVALLLWNAIFDPREILDLRRSLKWTRVRIEESLMRMFVGAIRAYDAG
jgi:AcrR family transcriptional regulator